MKLRNILMLIGATLLWSCSSEQVMENPTSMRGLQFTSSLFDYTAPTTRAIDTNWSNGDKIGVYAVGLGDDIANLDAIKTNVEYITPTGDGNFTSIKAIELDGKTEHKIIAYYPFQDALVDTSIYPVNLIDQSNSEKIDLLYSDNANGIKDNGQVELTFKHKLSKFELIIGKEKNVESLEGLTTDPIKGLIAEGTMNLNTGALELAEGQKDIVGCPIIDATGKNIGKKSVQALLMPGQSISTMSIGIHLDGQTFVWKPIQESIDAINSLQSGKSYVFRVNLRKKEDGKLVLVLPNNSTIEEWEGGFEEQDPPVLEPEEPEIPTNPEDGVFEINTTSLSFDATAASKKIEITASENIDWTLSTEADWITLDPMKGKGNGEVTINVLANDKAQERAGLINVTSADKTIEITVTQEAKVEENSVVVLYEDGFEIENKTMELSSYNKFIENKITLTPNFSYSKEGTKINVRQTFGGCIWFPAAGEGVLGLNNISSKDVDKIVLTLSMCAETTNAVGIENIKATIADNTVLEILPKKILSSEYEDYTITIDKNLISSEELTLKLTKIETGKGVRIGNIKIEAYK